MLTVVGTRVPEMLLHLQFLIDWLTLSEPEDTGYAYHYNSEVLNKRAGNIIFKFWNL